jgi:hypothetical protein
MLRPVYEERLAQESDPARREVLAEHLGAVRETMLTALAHLTTSYGGAATYLAAAGLTGDDITRLRQRIRD